jgi:hypothetical protein
VKYVRTPGFLIDLAQVAGETVVVWLRVANRGIYDS